MFKKKGLNRRFLVTEITVIILIFACLSEIKPLAVERR